MRKFRVLFFGTWGYGRAGLQGLINSKNVEIAQVYTKWNPEKPDKYMDQVKNLAVNNNLPVFNTLKTICSKDDFNKSILDHKDIDFVFSCCFDRIFKPEILDFPKIKPLNVHPSLLPKYRGIKPLENAIIKGEKETGITIHELEKDLDSGNIVHQIGGILISEEMTYKELYDHQCNVIEKIIQQFFENPDYYLENSKTQDEKEISWAPRLPFTIADDSTVREIRNKAEQQR